MAAERACARAAHSASRATTGAVKGTRGVGVFVLTLAWGVSWTGRMALDGPMRRVWACQRMAPTWCGARELEARRAAHGVSKEGGSRGAARGLVVGCLALREALSSGAWRWHRDGERGDRTNQRRAFGRVSSASGADGDGMHGALQPMRRLTTASGQVDIEVVRALNGWVARRWKFARRGHAGTEQGRIWGKMELTSGPRLLATTTR
jgi:hypothetical protein